MQSSTSRKPSVLEVAAAAAAASSDTSPSRDPEAADVDTKMASADDASHMSDSTESLKSQEPMKVEVGDEKPLSGAEDTCTAKGAATVQVSAGAATSPSDKEVSRLIDAQLGLSSSHNGKDQAKETNYITSDDASKPLPSFPALPSGENETPLATENKSPSAYQAMRPATSTSSTTEAADATGQEATHLTAPPPSVAIAKRPKPGGASSSKLRAANMPNNPSRGNFGSSNNTNSTTANSITPLRRGKWTVEEEEYAALVIQMFNAGYLPAPAGTTLRAYLSDKLHCDPMRITKKFTGSSCIGKRVFHPAVRCAENAAAIDSSQEELVSLEKRWRKRLKLKRGSSRNRSARRESKPTSAAAVSAPPTSADNSASGHHSTSTKSGIVSPPSISPSSEQWSADSSSAQYPSQPASGTTSNESSPPVPCATVQHSGASWIERAQALLGGESTTNNGPSSENSYARRKVSDTASHTSLGDKEPQTTSSSNIVATVTPSEAKDAEALVGFLNSVRAEAASGNTSGL